MLKKEEKLFFSKELLKILTFFILTLFLYFPTLKYGPFWDDWVFIFKSNLMNIKNPIEIWGWGEERRSWPLFYTTMWVFKKFFSTKYLYYHLASFILHSINTALLYQILKKLKANYAYALAIFFLIHPLHFFSVVWIVQFKTLLSIFFFLLFLDKMIDFFYSESKKSYFAALLFLAGSLFSKSVVVPIAPLFLIHRKKIIFLPFILLCLYSAVLTTWGSYLAPQVKSREIKKTNETIQVVSNFTPQASVQHYFADKAVVSFKNLSKYMFYILYPWKNKLVHPETKATYSFLDLILSLTSVLLTICIFYYFYTKKMFLEILFLTFFYLTIIPFTGIVYIPIFQYTNFVEYWLSIPLIGIIFSFHRLPRTKLITCVLCGYLVFLAYTTYNSARENISEVDLLKKSVIESTQEMGMKLVLAEQYFFMREFEKSNDVLNIVKENSNFNEIAQKLINRNNSVMNGERVNVFIP